MRKKLLDAMGWTHCGDQLDYEQIELDVALTVSIVLLIINICLVI